MKKSLFEVLDSENLNRLKISYNFKTDNVILYVAKEWDKEVDWSKYNTDFYSSSILSSQHISFNDAETRAIFVKHNQENYLNQVIELLRKGKHQYIDCYYNKEKNIRFINNAHSEVLGLNNRNQAISAGGIRRHLPEEDEIDVIIDGLNLGRGMSFKNYAARISCGGNKITVIMQPLELDDLATIGFLSYCIDRSRCFTGPDMNFPPELADVMKKHFSVNITGGPEGPLGATGIPTAYGVYLAAKEATRFKFNNSSLKGKSVAVQGLGVVGFVLAEHYLREGAKLIVADTNKDFIDKFLKKHPKADIKVVDTDKILYEDVDILSPCAIGGVFSHNNIHKLKASIIIGGANNQLKASSKEEEIELANLLKEKGIIFQVAWWHNGGGVLCGYEEYTQQNNAKMDNVLKKTTQTCKFTYQNIKNAYDLGITPTENAYIQVENHIYGDKK